MGGSKTGRAACLSTYLVLVIGALTSPTDAKDGDAAAPWKSEACNDACKWWMKLGDKPAAETQPVDLTPKPAAQALSLPAMNLLPPSAAKIMIDPFKPADRPLRRVRTIVTRAVVTTEARVEPARWGMPIEGSISILSASFELAH